MRNLILVSRTPIVIQIFKLVCKKLGIDIEVREETQIDQKVDIIVVDKEFIDDRFTILKTYAKQIGAITNDEMGFDTASDFTVPSPFLPSILEVILQEQLDIITKKMNTKTYVTSIDPEPEIAQNNDDPFVSEMAGGADIEIPDDLGLDEELEPAMDYLDSIADNIVTDIHEENDDSIVTTVSLQDSSGGVLDLDELSKIGSMVDLGGKPSLNRLEDSIMEDVVEEEDEEWNDLSDIIDQAIYEVNSTEQLESIDPTTAPINLKLNDFSLDELKPLLGMLDQDIIDALTDGKEIMLKLKLESDHV